MDTIIKRHTRSARSPYTNCSSRYWPYAQPSKRGLSVPSIVAGGTPTFSVFANLDIPGLECSPGTCVLHDHGYGSRFADLAPFVPAALLLSRVISRPTPTRITLDLGYKAVASDPPPANAACS